MATNPPRPVSALCIPCACSRCVSLVANLRLITSRALTSLRLNSAVLCSGVPGRQPLPASRIIGSDAFARFGWSLTALDFNDDGVQDLVSAASCRANLAR